MQKYVHDMAAWDSLSVTEQERVIGRTKLDDIELDDDEKPANSHIALNVITDDDGNELKIVRHNMPFGEIGKGEFGTYFIGYSRTPAVTERDAAQHVHRRPAGQHRPHPGLLHRRHRRDVLHAPPSTSSMIHRRFLIRIPRSSTKSRVPVASDGSLGDRQPERNPSMNNLYRDLAPITEAAWAEIELEATRTFKRHIAGRRVVDVSEPGGPVTAAISTGHLLDVDPTR